MSEILPKRFSMVSMWVGNSWTNGCVLTVDLEEQMVWEKRETAGPYQSAFLERLDNQKVRIVEQVIGMGGFDMKTYNSFKGGAVRYVPCFDDGVSIFRFNEKRDGVNFPAAKLRRDAWDKVYKSIPMALDFIEPISARRFTGCPHDEDRDREWMAEKQRKFHRQWAEFLEACREFWVIGATVPITKVRPFYQEEMHRVAKNGYSEFADSFVIPASLGGRQRKLIEWVLSRQRNDWDRSLLLKAKKLMLWDDEEKESQRKTLEKKVKRAAERGVVSSGFARAWFRIHEAVAKIFTGVKPKSQQIQQPKNKKTA